MSEITIYFANGDRFVFFNSSFAQLSINDQRREPMEQPMEQPIEQPIEQLTEQPMEQPMSQQDTEQQDIDPQPMSQQDIDQQAEPIFELNELQLRENAAIIDRYIDHLFGLSEDSNENTGTITISDDESDCITISDDEFECITISDTEESDNDNPLYNYVCGYDSDLD